jgi:twitching motility protein PilT
MLQIDDLLKMLVESEASDLHLRVGEPPVMRVHGDLHRVPDMQPMNDRDMYDLLYVMMSEDRKVRFEQNMELDMSYAVPGLARFRVNIFRQQGHIGAVMRVIPFKIRTLDELMIPPVVKKMCMLPRGLILVTGPTGSGKSTTLAGMVNHINLLRPKHIITIEDPIEYLHRDNVAAINQREIGVDTHSFAAALKHVMRQNPDIILVGEMRDLETISLAITAAETGHLVFGTLHTTDAPQTVDRVIDVFEPDAQQQVRMQLSTTLQGVISQTLLPRKDGIGRVAAFEVMVATPAIRTLIREGKTYQMYTDIQTGAMHGMQTLDSHLLKLAIQGLINFEDGQAKSSNPADFETRYKRSMERGPDAVGEKA